MTRDRIYAVLEAQMLGYEDLVDVAVEPVDEPLVALQESPLLVAHQLREEMLPVTGTEIYVRESVCRRLGMAGLWLARRAPDMQLQVGYGYRALSIQQANFERQREDIRGTVPDEELDEATHRRVAKPELGGHPAGAAVDIRLLRNNEPVDCGTPMWSFVRDSYTFSPFISPEARENRKILRTAMKRAGFAPFDGEWWHFSYGDREWAKYYRKPAALYQQLEFSTNGGGTV